LIPVPRHISSDCGFCVRFPSRLHEQVVAALKDSVEYVAIRPLWLGKSHRGPAGFQAHKQYFPDTLNTQVITLESLPLVAERFEFFEVVVIDLTMT